MVDPLFGNLRSQPDKSLHWTLSLRLGDDMMSVGSSDPNVWKPALRTATESGSLQDGVEPMFFDVSDREHLGLISDSIYAAGPNPSDIIFVTPDEIEWRTEGRKFVALFNDNEDTHIKASTRRFWYIHRDNSVTYHISFTFTYHHSPRHLYFISLLQKLTAPTEFESPMTVDLLDLSHDRVPEIFPFTHVKVQQPYGTRGPNDVTTFWKYYLTAFSDDLRHFTAHLAEAGLSIQASQVFDDSAKELFTGVPHLRMPRMRSMFFVRDILFHQILLPARKTDVVDGPINPRLALQRSFFKQLKRLVNQTGTQIHVYSEELWAELRQLNPVNDDVVATFEQSDNIALVCMFLGGFATNIIDFLNMDRSELLDSLDPAYPTDEEDRQEGSFVRYATPRSFITIVDESRSEDIGETLIGTCPYAFLIHVLSLHNEFLVREFEFRANEIYLRATETFSRTAASTEPSTSTEIAEEAVSALREDFWQFRRQQRIEYEQNYFHERVFRYDTERKMFTTLQDTRGIGLKHERVLSLVDNLERVSSDVDALLRAKRAERDGEILVNLTILLGLLGALTIVYSVLSPLCVDQLVTLGGSGELVTLPAVNLYLTLLFIGGFGVVFRSRVAMWWEALKGTLANRAGAKVRPARSSPPWWGG